MTAATKSCSSGNATSCDRVIALKERDKLLDELQGYYKNKTTPSEMKQLISNVADSYSSEFSKYGIDAKSYLLNMARIESSFDPTENQGPYRGLYQFGSDLALKDYNIGNISTAIRLDPTWSTAAAAQYALDNAKSLVASGISVLSPDLLYIAHQQGVGGLTALLKNPDTNAVDALMTLSVYQSNRAKAEKAIFNNGGNRSMTAQGFIDLWSKKYYSEK